MAKRSNIIKRKHLSREKLLFKKLINREKFIVTEKIKYGPRYHIVKGIKDDKPALFKTCLYPWSYIHLTNEKFSREVIFLDYIKKSKNNILKKVVPEIFAFSIKPRVWYIREHIAGQLQNIDNGNIRFKPTFFKPETITWCLKVFSELHSIKNTQLPPPLNELHPPQTPKFMWQFVKPYSAVLEHHLKQHGVMEQIKKRFDSQSSLYEKAPRVLGHQEPYAAHWIKDNGTLRLIDWENLGWANFNHDVVVLWMRAYNHPAWRHSIYKKFKHTWRHYKKFDELWAFEILIQSTFNIIGYQFYKDKKDFSGLLKFSIENVREILDNKFKPTK